MPTKKTVFLSILLLTLAFAGPALAAQVGYEFLIFGSNPNVPTVTLKNISTTAEITRFVMTIGNTDYNFDAAYHESAPVFTFNLITPDGNDLDGTRSNYDEYTFSGFTPGKTFQFDTDVDIDNSNTIEDYRYVLFNNGAASNSQLTVEFSNSMVLSGTLPDYTAEPYFFSQVQGAPLPGALMLLGSGLLGLIGFRRLTS